MYNFQKVVDNIIIHLPEISRPYGVLPYDFIIPLMSMCNSVEVLYEIVEAFYSVNSLNGTK